jgi:hypothetical protein
MKKQIKIGDKVSFKFGWGTVVDKYRDSTGHYWKYDVQLDLGYQIEGPDGWIEDVNKKGKIYSTRFVNVD